MNIVLVSKCSLDIEQYVEYKMSVLISPSKSLISSRWVTFCYRDFFSGQAIYLQHFLRISYFNACSN